MGRKRNYNSSANVLSRSKEMIADSLAAIQRSELLIHELDTLLLGTPQPANSALAYTGLRIAEEEGWFAPQK